MKRPNTRFVIYPKCADGPIRPFPCANSEEGVIPRTLYEAQLLHIGLKSLVPDSARLFEPVKAFLEEPYAIFCSITRRVAPSRLLRRYHRVNKLLRRRIDEVRDQIMRRS